MTHMTEEEHLIIQQRMNPTPNTFGDDTPDPGLENNLLKKCLKYCKDRGYPCWHDRSKKVNEPGWPDLHIYLCDGIVVLVELKSIEGVFRKKQQLLARQFMYLKHRYYKIRSFKKFLAIPEFNA